jgi:ABC-type dipeptide/oligopeptide/nickel transport system permease component
VVVVKHALKNALIPVVTVLGDQFGRLLGGAILTETVFAWPGMGRYLIESISQRDYPAVQGAILVFAAAVVIVNLLVDLSYGMLDPRVRPE